MVKTLTKYLFIFLLCGSAVQNLSAQDTTQMKTIQDTSKLKNAQENLLLKSDTVFHQFCKQDQFDDLSNVKFTAVDISLDGFQRYEPLTACAFLGNSGKAYKSLFFDFSYKPGFELGENAYRAYLPLPDDVKYYNVSSPFSDLYYVMGGSKEQILKVTHTQNVNKFFNIGLNFNIINSLGTYRRQKSDISNFVATTNYRSPNKRYTIIGNVMANKWYNYENGGLYDMTEFTNQVLDRPDLFDVNLTNAKNNVKETSIFLKQYLSFNKKWLKDSVSSNDSSIFNTRLIHAFNYSRTSLMYIDESPTYAFYPIINYENVYTGDSTFAKVLSNEISLQQVFIRNRNNKAVIYADAGVEHQYIDHRQYITYFIDSLIPVNHSKAFINQYIAKANLYVNPSEKINIRVGGHKVYEGYNDGDIGINAIAKFNINEVHSILLKASIDNFQPAFHASRYISNSYTWNYDFDKTNCIKLSALHYFKGFKTQIEINQVSDYIYYDFNARPKQYQNPIQIASFSVSKLFKWGAFYLDNNVRFQQSTNSTIMPLPLLVNNHSFYWSTYLFKKALYSQLGMDVYYNTAFYGYNYMPATRQFYLQSGTSTGNYPLVDVFVNLRIKRANIFLKLAHLNQGLTAYNYYSVPDYPLQGRALKLGVSWKFYD